MDSVQAKKFPPAFYLIRREILSRSFLSSSSLFVVELHVGEEGPTKSHYFRVVTTKGKLEKLEKGLGEKECRFARTIHDALAIFGSFIREKVPYTCALL